MSVSPELALAAAAAIKDKALEEQTLELLALRRQLAASHEVSITGRMGRPVYCRGGFSDGDFRESASLLPPGALWEVKLENEEEYKDGIPIGAMWPDMEIRLGGVVFATTSAVVGTKCRVRGAASDKSKDDVFCPVHSGDEYSRYNRIAWMAVNFRYMPEGPWKHLQSCAVYNGRVANDRRDDIWHKIAHPTQFPRRLPNQRADVTSICFHGASVLDLIRAVPRRDSEFERRREEKVEEIEKLVDEFASSP